ncbi:8724_t:CDS:2 [Entrophospora sp. SA101]|nr:10127_t:CDS:2 [Entrophospora sp. SA101]CAJ0766942.1 8724_t:CDS:2 [Entrophospora sp. SA101]
MFEVNDENVELRADVVEVRAEEVVEANADVVEVSAKANVFFVLVVAEIADKDIQNWFAVTFSMKIVRIIASFRDNRH